MAKTLRQNPRLTHRLLSGAWVLFVFASIALSAICFSWIFMPARLQLSLSLTGLLGLAIAVRLLLLALGYLHHLRMLQSGGRAQAERHFRWAWGFTPGNLNIAYDWASLLRQYGAVAEARERLILLQDMDPAADESYVQLAHLALCEGDWHQASRLFDQAYRLRRGVAWNDLPERVPHETPAEPECQIIETTVSKLNHDAQQLAFLIQGRYLSPAFQPLLSACHELLRETLGRGQGPRLRLSKAQHEKILWWYGRNVHISPVPAFPREVLHPDLAIDAISLSYAQSDPAYVVVDNLLQPDALEALLHFCQKSTIWHDDTKTRSYLGAYMDDGFSCDLLYQVAHDLRDALPAIFGDLPLQHMWAYKYDSQGQGIGIHADSAQINVNFWLTPDEANLDPAQGGLLIYPVRAPEEWTFEDYNQDTLKAKALIGSQQPYVIPYRQNRAVIFDSRLFHASDQFRFKEDYLLRRINVTLLYGRERLRVF